MAKDIFGKEQTYHNASVLTADEVKLIAPKSGNYKAGECLIQNVDINFSEQTIPVYEVGSNRLMLIPGKAMGVCQIGRIIGAKTADEIFGEFGKGMWSSDFDGDAKRALTLSAVDSGQGSKFMMKMDGCKIENYGVTIDAQGVLLQERVTVKFASLVVDKNK